MVQIKANLDSEQEATTPIRYREMVSEYLIGQHPEIIENIIDRIRKGNLDLIPDIKISLRDLSKPLVDLFEKDLKKFLDLFRKIIFKSIKGEILDVIERNYIYPDDIHIIIDFKDLNIYCRELDDFTQDWSHFVGGLCKFKCRYLTMGLDKELRFRKIEYLCTLCGSKFEKLYPFRKVIKKIAKPRHCIKRKCANKEFEELSYETYEVGRFLVGDLNITNSGYRKCYIFRNISYFRERLKNINLGEEVEILGVLRVDSSKFDTGIPDYFIDVIDIMPVKRKEIDEQIIDTIREKILEDYFYFEKLIDSTHPLTYGISLFFPTKLLYIFSCITGGSWNETSNIRNTLNCIVAGAKSTYKSSIAREIQRKMGMRNYLLYEVNKDMTKAGLIGTTDRNPESYTPTVRYGIICIYSNGTLHFDETEVMSSEIRNVFRCLEKGSTGGIQDASFFEGEAKCSLIFSQNCVLTLDGSYDPYKPFLENIGWNEKNSESLLDRFDLFYIIPFIDNLTQIAIINNERGYSNGDLLESIAKDLSLDEYSFPEGIGSMTDKLDYIHSNFFKKAKELFRLSNMAEPRKEVLRGLYEEALMKCDDRFESDTSISIRALNICYKLHKGLASLRLDGDVNQQDYTYFKQYCLKYIIPFKDSELIETKIVDINKIFRRVIEKLVFEPELEEIEINKIYEHIKIYIKNSYYGDETNEIFEEEFLNYLGKDKNLGNYKFKKLFKHNAQWLSENHYSLISQRGKGNISTLRKKDD